MKHQSAVHGRFFPPAARMPRFPFLSSLVGLAGLSAALVIPASDAIGHGPGMMGPQTREANACMGMNCAGVPGAGMMGGGMMGRGRGSMARHHQFMMGGVPEPYASKRNPLPDSPEVIARGRSIFGGN
jgi:hypothetical protein